VARGVARCAEREQRTARIYMAGTTWAHRRARGSAPCSGWEVDEHSEWFSSPTLLNRGANQD
jgi:hypothetical protein